MVARDSQRKEIRVDWAAALKSVVDQARRQAENWGATVVAITPDAPGGSGGDAVASKLNLLPACRAPGNGVVATVAICGRRLPRSAWRR